MISSRLVGTIIENKYSLDEQIGQGSMGAVFRATQLMVDRTVAIKLLQSQFASHDNFKARFEVEAKAIGRMNHPNCITLFDFGYSHNIEAFYTVVEFIQGRSLETLLKDNASLTTIVATIRQIASGLDHAHHHGILHRDLKPENIMLAQMTDGTEMVKVLDFGIAQIVKGGASSAQNDSSDLYAPMDDDFDNDRITRVGEVFGTPLYMSPEQARSTRNLTPACDLYSLGVIFYELVTGQLPFFSKNPVDILFMHINEPPPPIERLKSLPELQAVILALLEKDPTRRIQSGQDLISRLDAIKPEFLENESSLIPKTPTTTAHERPVIIASKPAYNRAHAAESSPQSWVETNEDRNIALKVPDFAPPPQAVGHVKTKPKPKTKSKSFSISAKATATSPKTTEKQQDRKSNAFQTMLVLDDVEPHVAKRRIKRSLILFFLITIAGLLVFVFLKNDAQTIKTLPFATTSSQPAHQAQPDPLVPTTNSETTETAETEPNIANGESATADTNDDHVLEEPTPESAHPASADAPPATQKHQTNKDAPNPKKKTHATTPKKPAKIKRDDSRYPPSKGPRILEF